MADKKPLSDKKLRRMLKKQKLKEEKKNSDKSSLDGKLPKEWQTPPKNLKGKEKGLWFRDRQRLLRQMKENESMMNVGKKLTKKERKALRVQLADQQKSSEAISQCFRIAFDPTREQMIEEYLNFVADEPPSFLIPQHEYHKKLKRKYPSDPNDNYQDSFATAEEDSPPEIFDIEENLQKTKRLYESFPEDITNGTSCISNASIQSFLNRDKTDHVNVTDDRYPHYNDSHSSRPERDSLYGTNNESFLDSVDKYKHLEDTPFKQSFLNLLSNSIQSNLQKALKHNAMTRNKMLDKEYYHAFRAKQRTPKYRHMLSARNRLPAFKMRHEILQIIDRNQIVLLSGETGCGKTTQVAQFILDEAIESQNGSICNILCTQPRRISAVSVAQRVADERAETVGRESIGYQIRLEKKIGRPRGAILYCTTGILLQYMQSDPALKKYSHIILDEIHERDTLCDFVLTILRDVAAKRTDLKIILMSATLNAEQFSKYFHDCPSMNIPGYTYPVEELYLEDVLALTKFKFGNVKKKQENTEDLESFKRFVLPYVRTLKNKYPEFVLEGLSNPNSEKINADLIVELIRYISFNLGPGAILVFVPGWEDINSIVRKINESDQVFVSSKFLVLPLHSMLPTANQQTVFDRPPQGQRKIVVATNIAETSITIDDVVYVIDCGKIKIKNYDVVNNISTLKPEFVSLANARQRRGRAGRVQNGVCYHLFSRGREKALDDYPLPEMLRTRLEETILSIKLLQLGNAAPFLEKVMDPPNPKAVSLALELLRQLNALDENENLTPLGFHLAKLPLDPQIGKMLLMGVTMSCLNPILSIAATLSFKDPFYLPLGEERKLKDRKLELDKGHKSDHLIMAEVIDRWEEQEKRGQGRHFCAENYLTRGTLYQLRDQKLLFAQYLCEMGFLYNTNYKHPNLNMNSDNIAMVKAVICSGLYPNVAIIKRKINTGGGSRCILLLKTSEDGKVSLHPKSVNTLQQSEFESNFLVYHEKLRSSCIFIYDSTMVSALPLLVFCYDFYLTYEKRKVIIQLNKDLQFVCNKKTANLIVELKLRLSWLLEYKLSHPGQVTWNDKSSDILLLKTLTSLFTTENDVLMGAKCDSSD